MTAGRLLALYDRVADAQDAVGRLRRFVLDLAVRGKLVPQDPADEPASALLKRIESARKLVPASGRKTKRVAVHSSLAETATFSPPAGWEYARLSQLVRVLNGRAYKKVELLDSGTPVLRVGNLFTSKHWYYSDLQLAEDKYCDKGDLLYAWSASFGPVIWQGPRVIFHYHIWKLSLFSEADLDKRFLYYFLLQHTQEIKGAGHGISMIHMTKGKMERLSIPVPPLAEQHRIVAMVDEFMALCDRLEDTRTAREDTRHRLTKASLARLTAPDTDAPTFRTHARFAVDALPSLTARADQVKQLRQTILSLAVRGRLVAQDPADEPASELLKRTEELPVPARYAKRSPELIPGDCGLSINRPEMPTPSGWIWVPLVRVARLESGHTPSRGRADWWGGDVPWMGLVDARAHNNGRIFDTTKYTNEAGLANSAARLLPEGTVCFSRTASVGYVVIMGRPMATSQDFVNWVPTKAVASEWLQLVMMAERPAFHRFSKGAVHQTIYYPAWLAMHVVLPPLAEQHRIVAKVDELMALCDRMEAGLVATAGIRSRLLESLLHDALPFAAREAGTAHGFEA